MGPDTYDLASLLRDSYVDIADRELDDLHRVFPGAASGTAPADDRRGVPAPLRPDGAAAQPEGARHVRLPDDDPANTVYIQYIPRTLNSARANLSPVPAFRAAHQLLAEHLEELR